MARSKAPRKRKPGKSGTSTAASSRITYPKRFLVSRPPESDYGEPTEFFYDTSEEAIQHCSHLGPQFFIDTLYSPPVVNIIRGFEQYPGQADEAGYESTEGAMTESMPLYVFIVGIRTGIIPVSLAPWDKATDNWADRPDEFYCDCGKYVDFHFTGKIPGL
ncbi:TPA: hypothetical protein ACIBXU_004586 [Salmonella enterica subsp. enterica serovar Saintpaul]